MAERRSGDFEEEVHKYQYIQYVIPDFNSIPRGKIVMGKFKDKVAKNGFEIGNGVCLLGPNNELPMSVFEILGKDFSNVEVRPCLDTLTPWPWVGGEGRRHGNVLCDLTMPDGQPDLTSPRQLLKAQLDALRDGHGLALKTAFEYEFDVFKEGTLEPLGGGEGACWDVKMWAQHNDLFCDLMDMLGDMGVEVSSFMSEFQAGQCEITTDPHEGIRAGDVAFYVKNAVKGFFPTRGYAATFMSKPTADTFVSTGLHLNHSLWKTVDGQEQNVLLDDTDQDKLSQTARHWLAGLLTHARAITALCCPTTNCYRRLFQIGVPGSINWGVDNRNALIRAHNAQDNVYFENRLPSGSCSPYLAMAVTVAAGVDGLNRKLECPKPMDVDFGQLPRTLEEALDALKKDVELCALLGDRFVGTYTRVKQELDVQRYKSAGLKTEEEQFEYERKAYMKNL